MNPGGDDYFVKRPVKTDESELRKTGTGASGTAGSSGKAKSVKRDDAEAASSLPTKEAKVSEVKKKDERLSPNKKGQEVKAKEQGGEKAVEPQKKEAQAEERSLGRRLHDALVFPKIGDPGSIDTVFLLLFLIILAFGAVMNFSSSYAYALKKEGDAFYFVAKHLQFILFGLIAFLMFTVSPIELYKGFTFVISAAAVVLLVLVLFIGKSRGDAQRWLNLPLIGTVQPSEVAKTAVAMLLALYMSRYVNKVRDDKFGTSFVYGMIFPGLIILLFVGLVFLENHFSGLVIIGCIGAFVMFLGGTKLRYLGVALAVAAIGVYILITFTDYAYERIKIFTDPWSDAQNSGWQTIQGLYAIASGGIGGVGLGNSRQKFGYVSEPQNDFIFSIVCEELGFIGAVAVVLLFFLLIRRGLVIARNSPNRFTYLLVAGLMVKVALQVGLNIAVVTKTIPNTGISLPFFSAGGSSLIMQMAEMGMVLCVSRYANNKK